MADSTTPTYGFVLPEVGASDDTWGTKLNANLSQLDALLTTLFDNPNPPNVPGYLKETVYGNVVRITGASPKLRLEETDFAEPEGRWQFESQAGSFKFSMPLTANFATVQTLLEFNRASMDLTVRDPITVVFDPRGTPGTPQISFAGFGTSSVTVVDEALGGLTAGIRLRMGGAGGGTTGSLQLTAGDAGYMNLSPATGGFSAVQGANDVGLLFETGIKIGTANAKHNGAEFDGVGFLPIATGSQSVDFSVLGGQTAAVNLYRFGRYASVGSTSQLNLLIPGTTGVAVGLRSDGIGLFGNGSLRLASSSDGTPTANRISVESATFLALQSGNASPSGLMARVYDVAGGTAASVYGAGTATPNAQTVITKEKGDLLYSSPSSSRYKELIQNQPMADLVTAFDQLHVKQWIWGGEISDMDERYGMEGVGFIAEELESIFVPLVRYQYIRSNQVDDEGNEFPPTGKIVNGADPMAAIAVLVAKIRHQEARIAALESN